MPADVRHRIILFKHPDNKSNVVCQQIALGITSRFPPQGDAFRLAQGEGFTGAHGDEVALYLRHQSKSEAKHFAIDG